MAYECINGNYGPIRDHFVTGGWKRREKQGRKKRGKKYFLLNHMASHPRRLHC